MATDSKKLRWGGARVAFFAVRRDVEAGLMEGKSGSLMFDELADRLGGMSYRTFLWHIRKMTHTTKPREDEAHGRPAAPPRGGQPDGPRDFKASVPNKDTRAKFFGAKS